MINWEKFPPIFRNLGKKKDLETSPSLEDRKRKKRHLWLKKIGTCTTNLRVYGRVLINGEEMEARSKDFVLIRKGTAVRVVDIENTTLVVEPLSA